MSSHDELRLPSLDDRRRCGARRAGRPRSEACRVAVLDAAYDVLTRDGLGSFTVERVAAAAAVGRTTIYRWWSSRGALAVECLLEAVRKQASVAATGDAIADLRIVAEQVIGMLRSEAGRIVAGILAEGQSDPETMAAFEEGYLHPRRIELETILAAGIRSGQLRPDLDVGMTIDLLMGGLLYRLLTHGGLEDVRLADRIVASAIGGCLADARPNAGDGCAVGRPQTGPAGSRQDRR